MNAISDEDHHMNAHCNEDDDDDDDEDDDNEDSHL